MTTLTLELKKDEFAVIKEMRKHGGFYNFKIEKKPTNDNPDGELTRIFIEKGELVSNLIKSMV